MMNRLTHVVGLVLLALAAAPVGAQSPIWAEEFNGTRLDPGTWTYDVGGSGFGNQELQYYTSRPENVKLENGSLVITGLRESYEGKQFTSARLKGHGRFGFRYGRIDARIKIPNLANGLWPAFWLLGDNIGQSAWPKCGEVDILEMGHRDAILAGLVNRQVFAAAHWDYNGSYANYGLNTTSSVNLNQDYHTYRLNWTPTMLTAYLDGVAFWAMDISAIAQNSLEEFHRVMFPVINLAVGGINFVQITDPAQITAPFPARLEVDWVRIYDNGYTELYYGADVAESGPFGIYTETTPVHNAVQYDVDSDLFAWHNVTIGAAPAYEGAGAWRFSVAAGDWFGLGVACRANRNMQAYSDGQLHLHMKTTSNLTLGIGIASSAAGEGWLDLSVTGDQFGLVRDGQWHEVVIPLNRFANIDFATIRQVFMLRGVGQAAALTIDVDNVYWTPSAPRPTPENGNFGVFTETPAHQTAGAAVVGVDQDFWIWDNTLVNLTTAPYDGAAVMSFQSATAQTWFGMAFMPRTKYNLSAYRYPASRLHFALKTSSTQTFSIGMKSGSVDVLGQKWIRFQNGQDPYGFVRDGQWHIVEIPMSDFTGVDLLEVSQLFEILGTSGPITNIAFDDVCFINDGAALLPDGPGDLNGDGYVDANDFARFSRCLGGPDNAVPAFAGAAEAARADADADEDVDLADFAVEQTACTGS
jgi:beta-glucanase (GH16 family)